MTRNVLFALGVTVFAGALGAAVGVASRTPAVVPEALPEVAALTTDSPAGLPQREIKCGECGHVLGWVEGGVAGATDGYVCGRGAGCRPGCMDGCYEKVATRRRAETEAFERTRSVLEALTGRSLAPAEREALFSKLIEELKTRGAIR